VVAYVRTVKTASGAAAVQIVHSSRGGSRDIEHIGSAHDEAELEVLKAAARQRVAAGQGELDLGMGHSPESGMLEIVSSLPIYHRKIESIDAHLTIVFAALAVSHWSRLAPDGRS